MLHSIIIITLLLSFVAVLSCMASVLFKQKEYISAAFFSIVLAGFAALAVNLIQVQPTALTMCALFVGCLARDAMLAHIEK